jgi:uridine kinase
MQRNILLKELAARILALQLPNPARIAIDGVDAAGKTSLADELQAILQAATPRPVIRASIDRFHNPREVRYRQGPDSPEGYYEDSFDLPELKRSLLDPLGPGGDRTIRTELFDFHANEPVQSNAVQVAADAVLLFDGVFLLRPELAGCWDFTIFVQVTFETVLARVVQRDRATLGDEQTIISRYRRRYIPAQRHYLEACRPAERADVVIGNDDPEIPRPSGGLED